MKKLILLLIYPFVWLCSRDMRRYEQVRVMYRAKPTEFENKYPLNLTMGFFAALFGYIWIAYLLVHVYTSIMALNAHASNYRSTTVNETFNKITNADEQKVEFDVAVATTQESNEVPLEVAQQAIDHATVDTETAKKEDETTKDLLKALREKQ